MINEAWPSTTLFTKKGNKLRSQAVRQSFFVVRKWSIDFTITRQFVRFPAMRCHQEVKSSGNVGGLLLYRFAAEFDLKRLEEENTAAADLNSLCEVLETVSLGAVKTTCCICARDVVLFDCWFATDWLLLPSCLEAWDFWNFPKQTQLLWYNIFVLYLQLLSS